MILNFDIVETISQGILTTTVRAFVDDAGPRASAVGADVPQIVSRGGGPALYVRGDEWAHVAGWPDDLRCRATRLWPGAIAAEGEHLPPHLQARSEWLIEREWRTRPNTPHGWTFSIWDLGFLIIPDDHVLNEIAARIAHIPGAETTFLAKRRIYIDEQGYYLGAAGIEVRNVEQFATPI